MQCNACKKSLTKTKKISQFVSQGLCHGTFHKQCVKGLAEDIKAGKNRLFCNNCAPESELKDLEDETEDEEPATTQKFLREIRKEVRVIHDVKKQLDDITNSLDFLSGRYEELLAEHIEYKRKATVMEKDITHLNNQCVYLTKCNSALEQKLNNIEQSSRKKNLVIVGLKQTEDEKVMDIAVKVAKKIGVTGGGCGVEWARRVPARAPARAPAILVGLAGEAAREQWMARRRDGPSLTSGDITGLPDDNTRIYINEDLTRETRSLLWQAKTGLRDTYKCVVAECEAANSSLYAPAWLPAALPPAAGRDQRCLRRAPLPAPHPAPLPAPAEQACDAATSFSEDTLPCDHWLYESHDTIVAEFKLACREWKRTLVGTVHNIGMVVSLPVLGYISDRWGRKTALCLSASLVGVVGTLKAFSVSYEMYVTVEFLEAVAGASAFPAAYILTIELLGQDRRVLTTAFLGITLVLGGICFALIAKALPYWRTFILAVYPPSILFLSYIFLLPESIRWLLSKGRREEAIKIITRAARMNRVTLSDETLSKLKQVNTTPEKDKEEVKEESLIWQVVRSPVIRTRLVICSFWWMTCTFVFYGLAINSVSLAGDKYSNYILVVSVEVVAVVTIALVLDRIGRKRTLLTAYTICGLSCIAITFVPKSLPGLATALYLLGKVTITMAFGGIYMYTSELFPTHARHSLLGFCSMTGRLGSIVAPQMPLLAIYMAQLPSILFGSTAIISGLLMLLTPETLHTRLPDTIREAEQLARAPPPAPPAPRSPPAQLMRMKP